MPARKPEAHHTRPTLTHALLGWLLIPFFFLLAVTAYATYRNASHLAETERDLILEGLTDDLQESTVTALKKDRNISQQAATFSLILHDAKDRRYFAIYAPDGRLVAGDPRLPRLRAGSDQHAMFGDIVLGGKKLRRAVLQGDSDDLPGFEIQVAETTIRRERLTLHLIRRVLVPQVLALLLSFPLIWFGVSRGLQPLEKLRQRIARRSAQDLNAIPDDDAPEELQPVIAALNGLLSQARTAQEEQQRFTADAAHQIKTPLAALMAEIDLARTDVACPCAQPAYGRLHQAASRLARLTTQLLALAHSEASASGNHGLFDLSELAREVTGDFVAAAAGQRIDLGFEGMERAIPVWGNAILVREAMKNLVENALKFTPQGGTVTTSARADPPVFSVADSGPGIPEAELPLIFQRFHRAPESSTTEGSGLGLAIVQEVARKHRAEITVGKSALGGALFELRFEGDAVSQS